MRILVDTNILFSALLFPASKPSIALMKVVNDHILVLTNQNIVEIREIIQRKKPSLLPAVEALLAELSYELIPAIGRTNTTIRDTKDQQILDAAILADVDMILTGDKDFLSLGLVRPKCLTAAEFLDSPESHTTMI